MFLGLYSIIPRWHTFEALIIKQGEEHLIGSLKGMAWGQT